MQLWQRGNAGQFCRAYIVDVTAAIWDLIRFAKNKVV
jgi:hypothetical protein